jgi:hypothetical protein
VSPKFGGARLPKELRVLPKRIVSRCYFVREAGARAEPRRWMCHHQTIPLIQAFIVSPPDRCHAQRTQLAWRTTKRRKALRLRLNVQFFQEPCPTMPNAKRQTLLQNFTRTVPKT